MESAQCLEHELRHSVRYEGSPPSITRPLSLTYHHHLRSPTRCAKALQGGPTDPVRMLLYGWKVVCFAVSLSGTLYSQNHAKSRLDITSVSILLTHGHTYIMQASSVAGSYCSSFIAISQYRDGFQLLLGSQTLYCR